MIPRASADASLLAAEDGPYAQIRTGIIAGATADTATVLVGGSTFPCRVLSSYAAAQGDLVAVVRQDSSWLVLGRIEGQGPNMVPTGSFENQPVGVLPDGWTLYDQRGLSSAAVQSLPGAPSGDHVLTVTPSSTPAASYVYSPPIQVAPGQVWDLGAFVGAQYDVGALPQADASLVALWFSNTTNLYPTTSSADTVASQLTDVTQIPPFTGLSGQVIVPAGTTVMRVAVHSVVDSGQALSWDFITARQRTASTDQGRGLVNFTSGVTDGAPATANTVYLTTAPISFLPGRAYRIVVKGHAVSSVAGDSVRIRVFKNSVSILDSFGALEIHSAAGSSGFHYETIVRNLTSNVVTGPLELTYARNTGTGNVFIGGSAQNPSYVRTHDVGPADAYPNTFQVP